MSFQIREPVLIVGLGGAGSRLAIKAKDSLDADVLTISNDRKDLLENDSIMVSTAPVINPTVQLIRGSAYKTYDRIVDRIADYSTIVIMANLAGKAGAALAPVVAQACAEKGKKIISFAIMPFRYEKNKIFNSGITLKRLRESSECTVVLDNDALLESNPSLNTNTCLDIANRAILHVVGSLSMSEIDSKTNIISTGTDSPDTEESLRDSLKMLYNDAPPNSIKRSILYVGGNDIPVGVLNSIHGITSGVLGSNGSYVDIESMSDESKVVMLSAVEGITKFDSYDPLGTIPQENTIDWSEPEVSIDCKIDLYQME